MIINNLNETNQVSSDEIVPLVQDVIHQQPNTMHTEDKTKKKKRCRGNRKEQHKRRKLRRRQMNMDNKLKIDNPSMTSDSHVNLHDNMADHSSHDETNMNLTPTEITLNEVRL